MIPDKKVLFLAALLPIVFGPFGAWYAGAKEFAIAFVMSAVCAVAGALFGTIGMLIGWEIPAIVVTMTSVSAHNDTVDDLRMKLALREQAIEITQGLRGSVTPISAGRRSALKGVRQ